MTDLYNPTSKKSLTSILLATSSFLVVTAFLGEPAKSETASGNPSVWIELGGQLERRDGGDALLIPVFESALEDQGILTPSSVQRAPRYSVGGEASVVLQPNDGPWLFAASVRYGRSNGSKRQYAAQSNPQLTPGGSYKSYGRPLTSDTQSRYHESHAVLDFEAKRDVGVGLFGGNIYGGIGIRMAQFSSEHAITAYAFPQSSVTHPPFGPGHIHYIRYAAVGEGKENFRGVGPSVSLSGKVPLAGEAERAALSFDWGVNGSLLFGRQKVSGYQATHEKIVTFLPIQGKYSTTNVISHFERSRSVVVPNVGATAGVTLDFSRAKVTLGYRADFFFDAMDGGTAKRETHDRSFYGPFATISIGLGG